MLASPIFITGVSPLAAYLCLWGEYRQALLLTGLSDLTILERVFRYLTGP